MRALGNRSWIALLALVGCLHLMPGVHEASHHDEIGHSAELGDTISVVGDDCAACGLLSSGRQTTVASTALLIVPPAQLERVRVPFGEPPVQRRDFTAQSPRAPPTA